MCMMHASQPPFRVACPMTPHLRIDDNSAWCMSTTHQWSTKGSFDINCGTFAHAHHHVVVNVSHSCLFVCVNATYPALQMRPQLLLTCPSAQKPTTLFVMLALCPTQHPVTARSLSCVPMATSCAHVSLVAVKVPAQARSSARQSLPHKERAPCITSQVIRKRAKQSPQSPYQGRGEWEKTIVIQCSVHASCKGRQTILANTLHHSNH
jgi:hypothetical protein